MKKGVLKALFLSGVITLIVANANGQTLASTNTNSFNGAAKGKTEVPSTIQTRAYYHTVDNAELGITVMKGSEKEKEFNEFKEALSKKLTEKGIPHKFFIEVVDKPGAAFAYFINGRQNGPFNFEEFVAMLPEAVRNFKEAHPTVTTASIGRSEPGQALIANEL
ncbi:MAG: hypothetical protein JXR03_18325 [Cyclobacteriaceae bacterium]